MKNDKIMLFQPYFSVFKHHAELAASNMSPLRRISGCKLSRSEPAALSHLWSAAEKLP